MMYSPGTKKSESNISIPDTDHNQQIQPDPWAGEVVGEDEYVKVSNYISAEGQVGIPVKQEIGSLESCSPGQSMTFQGKVEGVSPEQSYYGVYKSDSDQPRDDEGDCLPEQKVKGVS